MTMQWRWHDEQSLIRRVWRTDWFSDQFEILTSIEFENLAIVCKRFSIILTQADED